MMILLLVGGCAQRETTVTTAQRDSTASLHSRLDRIRAEIDTLEMRSAAATEEVKADLQEKIRDLRAQRDTAAARIAALDNAGKEAWENTKAGTDRMLEALENSVADARFRLKSRADSAQVK